jgi:hypothetical protein
MGNTKIMQRQRGHVKDAKGINKEGHLMGNYDVFRTKFRILFVKILAIVCISHFKTFC